MTTQLEGVHVALVTAFAADGSVDEEVFAELIEDQLSAGLRGLLVAGVTGEGLLLSEQESKRVLAVAVGLAKGSVPVTVQIGALSTARAVRNAELALIGGAQIGLLPPPFSEPVAEDELVEHYASVAQAGLPIMIYNNPAMGIPMPVELIARLAQIEGVSYLKDTTSEPERLADVNRLVDGALQVLHSKDSSALFAFLGGAGASVWGAPNATPHACVRLYELTVVQQDLKAARKLWEVFYPVLRFFETEGYMASVKAATELRGIPVGPPRRPLRELSDSKRVELAVLLDRLDDTLTTEAAESQRLGADGPVHPSR